MKESITQISQDFTEGIVKYFAESGERVSLSAMECDLVKKVQTCVCRLISQYIEETNEQLVGNRAGRHRVGYVVERHGDERRLLTRLGEISYARTYFANKDGTYAYLADKAIGVERYVRVSEDASASLAKAAGEMSYARSSDYVMGGSVSRQTVMNKVRLCEPIPVPEAEQKRKVPALHIDADEDHVTMRGGRKSIVPLISVYEGIEEHGKRHSCRNIIHISEYGKTPEALWEQALTLVEARYDLDGTRIYLHGDGAAWIGKCLEWFPGTIFVLDKHHKNKAVRSMTAGLCDTERRQHGTQIRSALNRNDKLFLSELADSLSAQSPDRAETIRQAAQYLSSHIAGIAICSVDPEANNGGCTEPHVSHVLSRRLSSRPMAWSPQTLSSLAPILANGGDVQLRKKCKQPHTPLLSKATRSAASVFRKARCVSDPNTIGNIIPIKLGKVSPLFRTLRVVSAFRRP